MTDKEKKMLPVLGVVVLFGVYWTFLRDDGSGSKRRPRPRPPAAKPAQPAPATNTPTPAPAPSPAPTPATANAADAGVKPVAREQPVDAAPPQVWKVAAKTPGKVHWVATKGRVIMGDVVVKYRGYRDADRQRERYDKRLKRQRGRLDQISDKLRAAMTSDDKAAMRRYERQLQGAQSGVEQTRAKLARATESANRQSVRAPASGVFTPAVKVGDRLAAAQNVGVVKEE